MPWHKGPASPSIPPLSYSVHVALSVPSNWEHEDEHENGVRELKTVPVCIQYPIATGGEMHAQGCGSLRASGADR